MVRINSQIAKETLVGEEKHLKKLSEIKATCERIQALSKRLSAVLGRFEEIK